MDVQMNNVVPVDDLPESSAPQSAPVSGVVPQDDLPQGPAQSSEQQANAMEAQEETLQQQYGTPGQQAIAGAEAVGRGVAGPLAPMAERALGVNPEDIRGREEANPITSAVGTIGGLLSPVGQGALLEQAGAKAAGKIVGEGILAGATRGAVKVAAENALYQSGDEVSKMILQDPNQTVQSAIANVGLAGIIGGATGGVLGAVSPLWKAKVGNKASQFAADFRGRMKEHLEDPDRVGTFTDELATYYNNIKASASEVYGPKGLKAQEIKKLLPGGEVVPEFNPKIRAVAEDYAKSKGFTIDHNPPVSVNPEVGAKIAKAYEEMPHDPNNPEVKSAYNALINETLDQYQFIKNTGLKIDPITPEMKNPYPNSRAMMNDIKNNNHLYYYPTEQGFGTTSKISDHPLLTPTQEELNGKPLLANDVFRIVHDYFGHAREGNGFGPKGEENAWMYHKQMFSPEAQKAMTTETRGQNSWVNFGPYGESNRTNPQKTVYADQKAGILPEWVQEKKLVHFSNKPQPLSEIIPEQQGTGVMGEERKRDNRVPRSYFYEQGTEHEKFVTGQAKYKYLIAHPGKILDLSSDEAKPILEASRDTSPYGAHGIDATALEKNIKAAGYNGYQNTKGINPGVIALFKKSKVEHIQKLSRDLTMGQIQSELQPEAQDQVSNIGLQLGIPTATKLLGENTTKKITNQMEMINTKSEKALQEMADKQVPPRYINKFKADLDNFQAIATDPNASPAEVFNATQEYKQTLQGYSKGNYGPFAIPSYHEAYDFLNTTKGLGKDVREALEDSSVWGKAADRQKEINKAFKDYLPALQDFEKKFTTKTADGERVLDPGKASTYFNQLGKPSAELKQSFLKDFLDASEKYKQVIADTHTNLGLQTPIDSTSTNAIWNTLKEQTHGAKLADIFVKKLGDTSGKLLGGAVGGLLGHLLPVPGSEIMGALIGEHAIGPFLGSIMPALAKPMMEKAANGSGLKSATEYSYDALKGKQLSDGAIKNLFKAGSKVIPDHKMPNKQQREKLDTALQKLQKDPSSLANISGQVGHYLPDHSVAVGSTVSNIVAFLNRFRPSEAPRAPLDPPRPVSKPVSSQYNRLLDIANQPLTVIQSIKDNTITSHDVVALQTMYPALYKALQSKMMEEIVREQAESGSVPYNLRMGLSMFLQQPLDSTMQPIAILSAQPMPKIQEPQPNPDQPPVPKKMTQAAGNQMVKGAKGMQTQVQASESMHSSGAKA